MIRMLRVAAISAFKRRPGLRRAVHATWEPIFRFALLPFRLPRGRGSAVEQRDLVRRTEEYNQAAERYYAEYPDPQYLLDKPFSDTPDFAAHMIAVGNLVAGARLRPGDTVVEFGAGSCWLSHFLNRYGCRTISVDVSKTALAAGRRLFERDPRTNWSLDPQFLPYDGHTLPLDDGACDRVVVYDAFHHVPNQREVLSEMYRVLAPDGVAAMSEPGKGHASSPTSIAETAGTGVLENELVIEDVGALAEDVGFGAVNVLAEGPARRYEIPVRELGRFKGGQGVSQILVEPVRRTPLPPLRAAVQGQLAGDDGASRQAFVRAPDRRPSRPRGAVSRRASPGGSARGEYRRYVLAPSRRGRLARGMDAGRRSHARSG